MATATSLTAETIEELMAGWEGVSVVQESQAALLSTFEAILASQQSSMTEWNDVTLPAIEADLAASAISIANLTDNLIPDLQVQIAGNTEDLQQLNDVVIPDLQAGLDSNFVWIAELNDVTLPALYADLAANNAAVEELNTVTLPAMQTQLDDNTSAIAAIDLTGLNAELDALQAKFPITGPDIEADAVTANHIASHTITALEIAADTITANEIAADTITANEIAADTITASEIAADTITANEIAADAITANEIAANAVTADEIAANTITAAEIAADTITANEIAADTITANEIAADTITANEIAADTITANEIATDAITANEIAAGAVTALEIAALTITGDKIAADTIAVTKLIVSDLTNLIVDGELLDPTSATWFEMGPDNMIRVKNSGEPAYLKNRNKYSSQYVYFRNENVFEIKQGDEFFISMEIFTPAGNTLDASFNPYLAVFDQNGGSQLWRGIEEGAFVVPPNTDWTKITGNIKITETGLATAQFNPVVDFGAGAVNNTQEFRIRKMQMRRKGTGQLIVDGSIKGKNLEANTITSDQIDAGTITGDLFAGEVIMGGLIRAGDLDDGGLIIGSYSEMGARGIYTVDTDGNPVFYAPTLASDGAYLKAHVDLLSADVRDNFTMHGTNNAIAVESELTLSAGVEAPSVPPVLQQVWDEIQFNKTTAVPPHTPNAGYNLGTFAFNPAAVTSICWDSTWSNWTVIQTKSGGFRVWRFNTSGGIANNLATGRPWVDDYNDRANPSACYNDDKNGLATLFLSGDQWYIWEPQYINKIPSSWIIDHASRPPTLTYDTINNQYCLVQNNGGGDGTIHVRRFTVNSGANFPNATSVSTNNFEANSGLTKRINGAIFGGQLGVSNSWVINTDDYQTVYTFNGSGVAYDDEGSYRNWLKPGAATGLAHNGSQFASLDSAGVLTFYENWTWLSADRYVWVGASAFDSDVAGDTANPHVGQTAGQHETPVGTLKAIQLNRRSKLRITMPETNDSGGADDPDKWKLYWKRGSSAAPTDASLLKLIDTIGSPTAATSVTISADPTGAVPPGGIKGQPGAINNFPGADPGRIESSKTDGLGAILQMLGDGTGRWGTLTVDSNGKAVIGGDTGWINATLTSSWTNYGAPYSGAAYRRIGNVVYLRGLVKDGLFGSANPIMTLPVGFRPNNGVASSDLILNGTGSSRAPSISGDGAKNTGDPDDNVTASTSGHTHGMKNHHHPITFNISSSVSNIGTRVDVMSDGRVHAVSDTGAWVSLSGISFLVD